MSYTRKLLEAIVSEDRLSTKEIFEAAVREKIMEEIEVLRPHIAESVFNETVDVSKVMSDYKSGSLGGFKAQGGRKALIKRKIAANLAKRAASVKEDVENLDELSVQKVKDYTKKSLKNLDNADEYGDEKRSAKRTKGLSNAFNKRYGGANVMAKEDSDFLEDNLVEDDMDLFDDDDKKPAKKQPVYVHTHKTSGKEIHSVNPKPPTNEFRTRKLREDAEQVDELSQNTLKSYWRKASRDVEKRNIDVGQKYDDVKYSRKKNDDNDSRDKWNKFDSALMKRNSRVAGMKTAVKKIMTKDD